MKTLDEIINQVKNEASDPDTKKIILDTDDAIKLIDEIEKYRKYYDRHQRFK